MPSCRVKVIRSFHCNVSCSYRSLCSFTDPNVLFLVDSLIYGKEDSDILLVCPLTDPDVLNFTLRKCDGKPLPKNMTFIPNPQKGIIIKNVQRSFKGCYQCLAKHNGVEKISEHIFLNVRPGNTGFLSSCRAPDFHLHIIDGKCSKEKSSLVSWACRREAQGGGSSRDFRNLLLRCASAPRNYFVAPLAAVGSPEKTGGLRKLVLGKLCEGTDCHVRHGLWLCWAGLATITHVSCLRWFPGVLFTM